MVTAAAILKHLSCRFQSGKLYHGSTCRKQFAVGTAFLAMDFARTFHLFGRMQGGRESDLLFARASVLVTPPATDQAAIALRLAKSAL
jgi:hypothetical protein